MIEMRLLEILAAFSEERTQAAAAEKLHIPAGNKHRHPAAP